MLIIMGTSPGRAVTRRWAKVYVLCVRVSVKLLSRVRLFATPWTVVHQAPLSVGFSRQEYCSGLPCPPPGFPSQPRDRTGVSHFAGGFFTVCAAREAVCVCACICIWVFACAHVRAQLCLTLQSHGYGPPGSSVPGISQARILEWVAIFFSKGSF